LSKLYLNPHLNLSYTFSANSKLSASTNISHGTGDMFAAAFTGAWLQNKSLKEAVQISADFTCQAIYNTIESPAHWYGVKFETALPVLFDALR
jgi:hydroxymethylpyrimidine/phosphomethylpyrimidine kinase